MVMGTDMATGTIMGGIIPTMNKHHGGAEQLKNLDSKGKKKMEVNTLAIEGLLLFTPKRFSDDRGYFMETFQEERYSTHIAEPFVQDNLSHSNRGVLRGLHLQLPPKAQGKLVQVL